MTRTVTLSFLVAALTAACGSSDGEGQGGTLQERLQGSWQLSGYSCGGEDKSAIFLAQATIAATFSGTTLAVEMASKQDGCTIKSQHEVAFDEAKGQLVLTPKAPDSCEPAGCDSSCTGAVDGEPQTLSVTTSGDRVTLSNEVADEFPSELCKMIGAKTPGAVTFSKK